MLLLSVRRETEEGAEEDNKIPWILEGADLLATRWPSKRRDSWAVIFLLGCVLGGIGF